jgi:hypothetical protein
VPIGPVQPFLEMDAVSDSGEEGAGPALNGRGESMVRPRRGGGLVFTGCGTARSAGRKDLSGSEWPAVAAKEHDSGACAGTGHKDENAFF